MNLQMNPTHVDMPCQLPQGVLKSVVASAGVHKVCATQLFDVPEALELWSVNDPHHQGVELYMPVNRVIEHLHIHTQYIPLPSMTPEVLS